MYQMISNVALVRNGMKQQWFKLDVRKQRVTGLAAQRPCSRQTIAKKYSCTISIQGCRKSRLNSTLIGKSISIIE